MKKLILIIALLATPAFLIASIPANHTHDEPISHSGGTNKYGCHNDRKNGGYHAMT